MYSGVGCYFGLIYTVDFTHTHGTYTTPTTKPFQLY